MKWRDLTKAPKGVILEFTSPHGRYPGRWYKGALHSTMGPTAWRPLPLDEALRLEFPISARERCDAGLVEGELMRLCARYEARGLA